MPLNNQSLHQLQNQGANPHNWHQVANLAISGIVIGVYCIRVWLDRKSAGKIVSFMGIMLVLCNVIISLGMEKLLLDLELGYEGVAKEIHGEPHMLQFDWQLAIKDIRLILVILTMLLSFSLMTRFTTVLLRDQYPANDIEKNIIIEAKVKEQKGMKAFLRIGVKFAAICSALVLIMPNHMMLNSSLTIYNLMKMDHLYWSMYIMFISCMISTLTKVWERVKVSKWLLTITVFWVYNVIILVVSCALLVIFNDALINLHLIIQDVTQNQYQNDYNISIITSLLLQTLNHNQCVNGCSTAEKVQLMAGLFASSKQYFKHCLGVLFSWGLVVFPMAIRILCISGRKRIPK